jgi:hypothetical protein
MSLPSLGVRETDCWDFPAAAGVVLTGGWSWPDRAGLRVAGQQLGGVEAGAEGVDLGLAGGLLGDQDGVAALLDLGVADAPGHQLLAAVLMRCRP